MALQRKTPIEHPFFVENGKPKLVTPYEIIDNILILTNGTENERPQIEFLLRAYDSKEMRDYANGMSIGNEKIKFVGKEYEELRKELDGFLKKCYEILKREIEVEVFEEKEKVNDKGEVEYIRVKKKEKKSLRDPKNYKDV